MSSCHTVARVAARPDIPSKGLREGVSTSWKAETATCTASSAVWEYSCCTKPSILIACRAKPYLQNARSASQGPEEHEQLILALPPQAWLPIGIVHIEMCKLPLFLLPSPACAEMCKLSPSRSPYREIAGRGTWGRSSRLVGSLMAQKLMVHFAGGKATETQLLAHDWSSPAFSDLMWRILTMAPGLATSCTRQAVTCKLHFS